MSHHERLCTSVLSEQRRKRKAVCSQITHETERCLFLTVRSTTMRPWEEKPSSKRKNCDSRRWCSLQVPCLFATQNVTGRQRYNWKRRMTGKLYWRGRESDRKQRLKLRENRKNPSWFSFYCHNFIYCWKTIYTINMFVLKNEPRAFQSQNLDM